MHEIFQTVRDTTKRFAPFVRFLIFQITWWLLVYSTKLTELTGIHQLSNILAFVVSVVSVTLVVGPNRSTSARKLLLALVLLGFLIDSASVSLGLIQTRPVLKLADNIMLAPPWLFAIWISFAATCVASVSFESKSLFQTPKKKFTTLAALAFAGALGGPLSYLVGGPIEVLILQNRPISLIVIAIEWSILFPAFLIVAWLIRAEDHVARSKE